ncbi:mitochondrial thiamine pyrophosphate carrier 1 [Yarrowia lipolytica]|jgi:solute carrier family 25 thiamine pyrophosphate transporter 19|uniref:Mitochondrial thiamine pyrophosphate carrier 1 n=2 Tax=Yarrowia lipolytica TaxID=4952 RepID=TPC1_YARLI|nr:YALI0F20262p [Yarrowia lipolytica CLIB122]Q6C107.1 RecName: Full=Mitochondrial thiamine pyrophosphate carrier 1 [Yarrowia lipolytica CLIB122]AOW07461.1 hypothetical protein YALI1_F26924g [Yarrowia lipolytica]KAB8286518.1 mitochondrial thiamine pyrophosphate carrier 1 [Yarrowia lipolytica]KAE8173537.1 mitochondrial thiamine pyrophosphate carrier 1 [Yarrowia lipolytica]KAJ8055465.1 mitochondrial thiamine pyrophosphate carrier 1 [Yarrowia lipolytica]QNP99318.1 Mitochondrial thiamine pyrophosp|eukprot:XP_505655.1 YALI0F20262p [Yarrowia lipolytica CLIB122]
MSNHLSSDSDISSTESMLCGGIAGMVSRFCIAPLDVVKIRLQLQKDGSRYYRGIFQTMQQIVRDEGVTALWKGNIPAELLYVFYGATQFVTYHHVNQVINAYNETAEKWKISSGAQSFIAGATAGAGATIATYPFDLFRTLFAAQGAKNCNVKNYTSLFQTFKLIYKTEGPLGFFRGVSSSIISIAPYMGLFFASYGRVKDSLDAFSNKHHDLLVSYNLPTKGWQEATAGLCAGTASKALVFPLDTIRKRLQTQGRMDVSYKELSGKPGVQRLLDSYNPFVMARRIIVAEGCRGLYKGFLVSLIKSAPTSAITMYTFEKSLSILRWWKAQGKSLEA